MKIKSTLALALVAVATSALSSCGKKNKSDFIFWSSFGSAYTEVLNNIVVKAGEAAGAKIDHKSKGSYDNVLAEMLNCLADRKYPDMVTGYPDHFAEYLGNDALQPLDKYVERYNQKHGVNLLEDYESAYMTENYDLAVDDAGNKVLSALPFNKSTELMGYNGVFVDYCASLTEYSDDKLQNVPKTWQEWQVKGPKYREILTSLATGHKALYGVQNQEGTASQFHLRDSRLEKKNAAGEYVDENDKPLLLDFTDVDVNLTRVISWDSTDNMFITLVRQWGGQYTRLPDTEKKKEPLFRKGEILFNAKNDAQYGDVRSKVVDCMKFFNRLNKQHIFGVPSEFQAQYSSTAFEQNKVMFMLCSSGGLSYNTAKWTNRFKVAPLPYNEVLKDDCKYVISQGANITLTDRAGDDAKYEQAFEAMAAMTTGELQAKWCLETGYYPCSKSAASDPSYKAFLESKDYSDATAVAYREGAILNQNEYMDAEKGWHKFVDPAFIGSSIIRKTIKSIFSSVFVNIGQSDVEDTSKYETILQEVVDDPTIKQNAEHIKVIA